MKTFKRYLSLLLSVVMLCSLLPATAVRSFAASDCDLYGHNWDVDEVRWTPNEYEVVPYFYPDCSVFIGCTRCGDGEWVTGIYQSDITLYGSACADYGVIQFTYRADYEGQPYYVQGDFLLPLNPDLHESVEHVDAVPATTTSAGNIEYWHCVACDKYYADSACIDEITQAETVLPPFTGIPYLDASGSEQGIADGNYTVVTSGTTTLSEGWYVVHSDVTVSSQITGSGDVNLILCDGATFTAADGIYLSSGSLTIYGQSAQTGTLSIPDCDEYSSASLFVTGGVTVNGGILHAQATKYSRYAMCSNGPIVINRGSVLAVSTGDYSTGMQTENLVINGGTVTVSGIEYGIGGGNLVITGGTVNATGYCGFYGDSVDISGGTVTITSSSNTSAVSCPNSGTGITSTIRISGGTFVGTGEVYALNGVTLSWTDPTDSITATEFSSYQGTVTLAKDFYNGTAVLNAGVVTDTGTINGKELVPATPHAHVLTHTDAVAATCTTDGNIEYWYCPTCSKYFADADGYYEITQAQTVVSQLLGYIDADGSVQGIADGNYTVVTSGTTTFSEGWYAVTSDVTVSSKITGSGNVNLILCDGATLTAEDGIDLDNGSLTIYGQSAQTGTLSASGSYKGIYTSDGVTVNGGVIDAQTAYGGALGSSGNVVINRGSVTASGTDSGSMGIFAGGNIEITGGTVEVSGQDSGINGGNLVITGGTVNATGYCGFYGDSVDISGGTVTITSSSNTSAVSCPNSGSGITSTIRISGGTFVGTGEVYALNGVTLSWTNPTDSITATEFSSYQGTVTLEKQFYNGTDYLDAGAVTDTGTINGKTLGAPIHEHALTHLPAQAPTGATDGNIDCWYCATCDRYFADEYGLVARTRDEVILAATGVATVTAGETTERYTDFAAAVSAWSAGSTLTLLEDVTSDALLTVPAGEHTLDLNGHGLTSSTTCAISIPADATLNLIDSGSQTRYYTLNNYVGVLVDQSTYDAFEGTKGSFTGGYITTSRESTYGGIQVYGTLNMHGGTVIGFRGTSYDGGVFTKSGGVFHMDGGNILGNYIDATYGAGVYIESGSTFTLSGGVIRHNSTTSSSSLTAGGVNAHGGTVRISGNPVVADNTNGSGAARNIYLYSGTIEVVGALTAGARLGVSLSNNTQPITNGYDTCNNGMRPTLFFFSDNDGYTVRLNTRGEPCLVSKSNFAASITADGITDCYESFAEAVSAWTAGSTLTPLRDITIDATLTVPAGEHTLDLDGHGLIISTSSRAISIPADATLNLTDSGSQTRYYTLNNRVGALADQSTYDAFEGTKGSFTGGYITTSSASTYGGIQVFGTLNMHGGTVIGFRGTSYDGGVFTKSGGVFHMDGGNILGNYIDATYGAGVYIESGSTFTLSGGVIRHNSTTSSSGLTAGGVNAHGGTVRISGNPVVADNTNGSGAARNIYLYSGTIEVTGALSSGARLGVSKQDKTQPLTSGYNTCNSGTRPTQFFFSDDDAYTVRLNANGEAFLASTNGFPVSVTANGITEYYENIVDAVSDWTVGSTLTLRQDVTALATVSVPSGMHTLDLNGHGLIAGGSQNFSVLTVPGGAVLALNDSNPDAAHKYTVDVDGLASVDDSATGTEGTDYFGFTGGYLTGANHTGNGGGAYVAGILTMYGGTILGNHAEAGGGVYLNSGTFTMRGGVITCNTVGASGGGVCLAYGAAMDLYAGAITKNRAARWGGGIYTPNTANPSNVTLYGGAITENVCCSDNGDSGNGGGIQISHGSKLYVSGNPVVTGNTHGTGANAADNDVFLNTEQIHVIGALSSGASIGVAAYGLSDAFTDSTDTSWISTRNFFSNDADYFIEKNASGQLVLYDGASEIQGTGTELDPYRIYSAAAWDAFAAAVNGGNSYAGAFVKLCADISVSTVAGVTGSEVKAFSGTFDGDGHVLNVTINDTASQGTAPFREINGATIKNLTVTGSVQGTTHAAGLVGFARGGTELAPNLIENCVVSTSVIGSVSGNYRHIGGVVGHGVTSYLTIKDTVFNGTMSSGGQYAGGLQGWSDGNHLTVENSFFVGTYTGGASFHPIAIHNTGTSMTYTDNGAYYTQAPTLTDANYIGGTGTKVEKNAPSFAATTELPAPDGSTYYRITGGVLHNAQDWDAFAQSVNDGTDYAGLRVMLADDFDNSSAPITTMAGTENHPFRGSFNGNGKTLYLNLETTEQYCAPFRYVENASFCLLHTTGTIRVSRKDAGGIISLANGTVSLTACRSSVDIISTVSGDGTHGGLVGASNNSLTFVNCLFDGSISGSSTTCCGGFVGWRNNTVVFTNCLMGGTMDCGSDGSATFSRNLGVTVENSYYRSSFGDVQGTAVGDRTNAELAAALGSGWSVVNDEVLPITNPMHIGTAAVSGVDRYVKYTGDPIALTPVVTALDGTVLTEGTDYTVSYDPATVQDRGDYTLTVTGTGEWSGTHTVAFTVGDEQPVTENTTVFLDGWIYRADATLTNNHRIEVEGDAILILNAGVTLTLPKGIHVNEVNGVARSLTIRGEGKLVANADDYQAAIGSNNSDALGNIRIEGGEIEATGGSYAAGIGGGRYSPKKGSITITGGKVTATGRNDSAGIGGGTNEFWGGHYASVGDITITGGEVVATGSGRGAGIGGGGVTTGGSGGHTGTITITGGKVTATGGGSGYGIGPGVATNGYTNGSTDAIVLGWADYDNDFIQASSFGVVANQISFVRGREFLLEGTQTAATASSILSGGKLLPLPAAQIENTMYRSLEAALAAAANDDAITMLRDDTFLEPTSFARSAKIDLNGHTVTFNNNLLLRDGACVEIGDSSAGTKGELVVSPDPGYLFQVTEGSELILSDGIAIRPADGRTMPYCILLQGNAPRLQINNVNFTAYRSGVCCYTSVGSNFQITVQDGVFTTQDTEGPTGFFYNCPAGSLNITGGYYSFDPSALLSEHYLATQLTEGDLTGYWQVLPHYVAQVGSTGYLTFAEAVTAAAGTEKITLLENISDPYPMSAADQTILVVKNGFDLTVTAPTGNYLVSAVETPAQEPDPAYTTYTAIAAAASVGGTLYASFPEAVTAAAAMTPAEKITLLADISEAYQMTSADQTFDVIRGAFALTVTAPTGNYVVSAVETPAQDPDPAYTTYTAIAAVASVGGTLYARFPEAVTAAAAMTPAEKITLLADISEAYQMTSADQTFDVIRGAFALTVTAPTGNYVVSAVETPAQDPDPAYTTYTAIAAVASVGGTLYASFPEAVTAANETTPGGIITLLAAISEPYTLPVGQTLQVNKGAYELTVNAPDGNYIVSEVLTGETTTYSLVDAVAVANGTKYHTFAEAVTAAGGSNITLLADAGTYTLSDGQTLRVILGGHLLTVNAPSENHRLNTSTEENVTVYTSTRLYAQVGTAKYESFASAAAAANGVEEITLLRDMDSSFSMNSVSYEILRVVLNGHTAQITDYAASELHGSVTYYYKTNASSACSGSGFTYVAGGIAVAGGVAAILYLDEYAGGGAATTVVLAEGASLAVEGGDIGEVTPENPQEQCIQRETEGNRTTYKNLKLTYINVDFGITIMDAASSILPDAVNDIWADYNQNISSIVSIAPPVLEITSYADVRIVFPYPKGWVFPNIFVYLPETLNPGNHFVWFTEDGNAAWWGHPYVAKVVTEPLSIAALWVPYEAAIVKENGDLEYYLAFNEAAADANGRVVNILHAPVQDYTLKKTSENPVIYETLKLNRGFCTKDCVIAPDNLPEGWSLRTWTYQDSNNETITCYTVDTQYVVTFVYNNGAANGTQNVYNNQTCTRPTDPTRPGWAFTGWFTDDACTQLFDFTTAITASRTLYAGWNQTAVAKVGEVYYASFPEAVTAAAATTPAGRITLLANIAEPYTMTVGQTMQVIPDGYTLTVNPPAGNYLVTQTQTSETVGEGQSAVTIVTTTYTAAAAAARVEDTLYATLDEALTAAAGKTAVLLQDVTTTATVTIPTGEARTLDLNGYGIRAAAAGFSVITIPANATLLLTDSSTDVTHKYTVGADGLAAVNDALTESYQSFTGGYLTGGTGTAQNANKTVGGGIYVNGGTLTMSGGTILGNKADSGAGVYVDGSGTFTMNGGAIRCNAAENPTNTATKGPGGGVYVTNGTFTMNDGLISGNTAFSGAGVYLDGNSFTMTGGSITDNAATVYAGGVLINVNRTFSMSSGTISGNTAGSFAGGGVVLDAGSVLELSGDPTISGNTKGSAADNVYLASSASIKVTDTLTNTTPIGVTMQTPGAFTSSTDTTLNDAAKFASDSASTLLAQNSEGQLLLHLPITVTWLDWDGTLLETDENVTYGTTPSYSGSEPTRAMDDATHTVYTFQGWDPLPAPVTGSTSYTAQYESRPFVNGCFVGCSLSLEGDIGINFYVDPFDSSVENLKVVFTWDTDKTATVLLKDVTPEANGSYRTTARVAAKEMKEVITATLYAGDEILDTNSYSIAQYAKRILDNEGGEFDTLFTGEGADQKLQKLQSLCRFMLLYGAKSQLQFGYQTGALADDGMSDKTLPLLNDTEKGDLVENNIGALTGTGLTFAGTSLLLKSRTTYRVYFTGTPVEGLAAQLVGAPEEVTVRIGTKGSYTYVDIEGIPAKHILDTFSLRLGTQSGETFTELARCTCNAGAYIKDVLEDQGTDEDTLKLQTTVTAIFRYCMAAKTYFSAVDTQ